LIIIIPNIFFFASIFVVGQFINVQLLLISIVGSNLGLLLTIIVWNLLGNPKSPVKEIGGWAGGDFGAKNQWLTIITLGISLLVILAYPIIIGINYFSLESPEEIRIMTLKYSSLLILITYILSLPLIIGGFLASSFIDEDTRARGFLNQFGGLIAYSLFISLLFWAYNTETTGNSFQLGNINLFYSPKLLLILIGFPIIFLVLPYFIGIQKAKRLNSEFLTSKTSLLNNIIDSINLSTEKNIISNIEGLEKEIVNEYEKLVNSDDGVKKGIAYDNIKNENEIPTGEELLFQYYLVARPFDIRFNFYDFLNKIYSDITELKESLENNQLNNKDKTSLCNKYIEHFKSNKNDLIKKNEEKGKTNPALWIGILTILSPFTSQILSEIGKYLISVFKNI
jgi:hypothetical protein